MHYKMTVERFCIFKRSYQLYIFGHFCLWFAVTLTLCRHHSGLFASSWQRTPTVFLVILWFFFFFFFFWYLIESKILFDLKKQNKLHLYLVLWANFSTCTSRLSIPGYSCMTNKKNNKTSDLNKMAHYTFDLMYPVDPIFWSRLFYKRSL